MKLTDEELNDAMTYGFCEYCGGPRTIRTVWRSDNEGADLMTCRWCGRGDEDEL